MYWNCIRLLAEENMIKRSINFKIVLDNQKLLSDTKFANPSKTFRNRYYRFNNNMDHLEPTLYEIVLF